MNYRFSTNSKHNGNDEDIRCDDDDEDFETRIDKSNHNNDTNSDDKNDISMAVESKSSYDEAKYNGNSYKKIKNTTTSNTAINTTTNSNSYNNTANSTNTYNSIDLVKFPENEDEQKTPTRNVRYADNTNNNGNNNNNNNNNTPTTATDLKKIKFQDLTDCFRSAVWDIPLYTVQYLAFQLHISCEEAVLVIIVTCRELKIRDENIATCRSNNSSSNNSSSNNSGNNLHNLQTPMAHHDRK